jgi:hypothetical protein
MSKETYEGKKYTFSQPKPYQFVVQHGGKICLALLLFMLILAIIESKGVGRLTRSIHVIVFLAILFYLTGRLLTKFAYKIIVDFESCNINLFMNRTGDIIIADFDTIKNIRVNGYIIFILKERTVFYSGRPSEEILSCLNRIKKIDWGILCALLGPRKSLRDELERT